MRAGGAIRPPALAWCCEQKKKLGHATCRFVPVWELLFARFKMIFCVTGNLVYLMFVNSVQWIYVYVLSRFCVAVVGQSSYKHFVYYEYEYSYVCISAERLYTKIDKPTQPLAKPQPPCHHQAFHHPMTPTSQHLAWHDSEYTVFL